MLTAAPSVGDAMRLRWAGVSPPMREFGPCIQTPLAPGKCVRPSALVLTKQPSTTRFAPLPSTPPCVKRLIARPRIVTSEPWTWKPGPGAAEPSISMSSTVLSPWPTASVFSDVPGCV